MKKLSRIFSLLLVAAMLAAAALPALAAQTADATINMDAQCSIDIYKYDFTSAAKDGVWTADSFVSTGMKEAYVEKTLGQAVRVGDADGAAGEPLGNGQTSNGYALKGVEFTYRKVADIVTFTESANDRHADYNMTQVLYGFDKVAAADLLKAIGLADGANRYANADGTDKLSDANYYYTGDVINAAMRAALAADATTVKDALEAYCKASGTAMALTDADGHTSANDLSVGLYLLVETKVPEMVTSTTNPFFISLPMTTVDGNAASVSHEGGHGWNYNVTVYPKNETGIPSLEKTVREAKDDTGKNNGTSSITDGFAHNATASAGDILEYQIVSSLPTITSNATALDTYKFYDTLGAGLTYDRTSVKVEIFKDAACEEKVASWSAAPELDISYSDGGRRMTVSIAADGLAAINGRTDNEKGALLRGYSNYTVRLTYSATVNSDQTVVFGDSGNCNSVVLTWKRTSTDYYDTLIDDCHIYTYGVELTKLFSDKTSADAKVDGLFEHVKFNIRNETDGYYVKAELNADEGVYYVTGHAADEADATAFVPVTSGGKDGVIMVKGLEDDEYIVTELETANGYTLLADGIHIVITAADDAARECDVYSGDVLGVLQNDPHYSADGGLDLALNGIPQKQLSHNLLTASATVDTNAVTMLTDGASANAEAPLTVTNTHGYDLPQTGQLGARLLPLIGAGVIVLAVVILFVLFVPKRRDDKNA